MPLLQSNTAEQNTQDPLPKHHSFGTLFSKEPARKPIECDALGVTRGQQETKDSKLLRHIEGAQIRSPK